MRTVAASNVDVLRSEGLVRRLHYLPRWSNIGPIRKQILTKKTTISWSIWKK